MVEHYLHTVVKTFVFLGGFNPFKLRLPVCLPLFSRWFDLLSRSATTAIVSLVGIPACRFGRERSTGTFFGGDTEFLEGEGRNRTATIVDSEPPELPATRALRTFPRGFTGVT